MAEGNTDALLALDLERVVCALRRPEKSSDYDVYSLDEISGERGVTFILSQKRLTTRGQSPLDELSISGIPDYLRSSSSRRVHVVVSQLSGTGVASSFYEDALQPLLASLGVHASSTIPSTARTTGYDYQYDLAVTQDDKSLFNFACSIGDDTGEKLVEDTIILLSGDGGVIEMLNGRVRTEGTTEGREAHLPLIAILPLGTGNALFNSLHNAVPAPGGSKPPSALVQGLRTLLRGTARQLPSFEVELPEGSRTVKYVHSGVGSSSDPVTNLEERGGLISHLHGAVVASYGFHSQLVWESDTPEYRKHGVERFSRVAQELLKESHAYRAKVELFSHRDEEGDQPSAVLVSLDREQHAYILATMVSHLEKTFRISPLSKPLDGRLRLVHFGAVSGHQTVEIMKQAYNEGKHIDMTWRGPEGFEQGVGYEEIAEIRIIVLEQDPRWRKVCIDGTIVEIPHRGCVIIRKEKKKHLRVLVDVSVPNGK